MFQNMASMEAKMKYVETEIDQLKKRTDALEASMLSLMEVLEEYLKRRTDEEVSEDVEEGID